MQNDLHDAFKNIFDARPRGKNASIENFLKENANNPDTLGKKLTYTERQAADEEISLEELKETLEDAKSERPQAQTAWTKNSLQDSGTRLAKPIFMPKRPLLKKKN